jgi:hypothetical protein
MEPIVSGTAFDLVFAFAPLLIGVVIYCAFYAAKRHEATEGGVPIGQTYACAGCGRRGARDQMVPREFGGAVGWYCSRCANR